MKLLIAFAHLVVLGFINHASAQNINQMVRLAKLVIDSTQLENYKAALKQEIETSVRIEPGVKTLYAVSEKDNPPYYHPGNICRYGCIQSAFANASFHKI